jgi:hypothetical protein
MSVGSSSYYLQSAITVFDNLSKTNPAKGMRIDLSSGDITATTGNFYGSINIYPNAGGKFTYNLYKNTNGNVKSNGTGEISSMSLSDLIIELKSAVSRAQASADAADYVASYASG